MNCLEQPSNEILPTIGNSIFISPTQSPVIQSYPLISMIIIGLAVRPLVVFIHVMGHAIVARMFAKQKIVIFLGSYGDKERSANVVLGSLEIWFTGNPFLWQRGLCDPSFPITRVDHRLAYVLAGPVLPVAVSAIIADAAVFLHFGQYTEFVALVFFGVSVIDFAINLIPYSNPIAFYNTVPVYMDGYAFRLVLLQKKYPNEFFVGINQYSKEDYADAAHYFEKASRKKPHSKTIYRHLLDSYRKAAQSFSEQNDSVKAQEYFTKASMLEGTRNRALS